jgi:hypothetical protein
VAEPAATSLCLSLLGFRTTSIIPALLGSSSCWPNGIFDRECDWTLTRFPQLSISSVLDERSIPTTASLVLAHRR